MNSITFRGSNEETRLILDAMYPHWMIGSQQAFLRLINLLLNEFTHERAFLAQCEDLSRDIARNYINPYVYKNRSRMLEIVNCLYNPDLRMVTITVPLDKTQSRYVRIEIKAVELTGLGNLPRVKCKIAFSEEAATCFAALASRVVWELGYRDMILVVDDDPGCKKVKWKHLAVIAGAQSINFDLADVLYDVCMDEIPTIWGPQNDPLDIAGKAAAESAIRRAAGFSAQ